MSRTQNAFLKIFFLTCLLACGISSFAQTYLFNHPDLKEAAPGSFLYRAFEDSKGYTWLISYTSVSRFDGKKYRTFGPEDGFYETGAFRIMEDAGGVIWVLTVNFKLYFFKDDVFREIPQKVRINWVLTDEKGDLWAFGRDKGVTYRLTKDGILSPLCSYTKFGNCYIAYIVNDSTHLLYLTTGIYLWKEGRLRMLVNSHMHRHHIPSRFFRIRGKLLVTTGMGIYEWKNNRLNLVTGLDDMTEVFDMLHDPLHDHTWAATSKGLLRYTGEIESSSRPEWYLKDKSVLSVSRASDGNYWATTANSGTYVFNSNAFHLTAQHGLRDEDIRYAEKESGTMYFFSRYSPFYRYRNNRLDTLSFPRPDEKDEWIKAPYKVMAASDTSLALFSTRTMFVDKGKVRMHRYDKDEAPIRFLSNNWHVTGKADWTLLRDGKVLIDSARWRKLVTLTLPQKKIRSETLNQPAFFDGDTLYMTCDDGIVKCYWIGDRAQVSVMKMAGMISYITKWRRSLVVCTRTHGIYVQRNGSFANYNDQNGLLSNYCFKAASKDQFLWVSTVNGLSRINLLNGSIRNYTSKDYLVNNEVNDVNFLDDTIFVATAKGVSFFCIKDELPLTRPSVFIERLLVNNDPVPFSRSHDLTFDENNISLTLCSPGYRSADYNRFRVIISHDGKVDTTFYKDGLIQLLALMPGKYVLNANVMNMDGVWGGNPVEIFINIAPPFWKSWWFILLAGILSVNVAGYVVWLTVKRQKDAQEYNRKIVESELRSLRLYMNPHFLFNSLASLQAFVLTRKNQEANTFITTFSKLIRSVMTYSIRGELTLSEEIALLRSYLELESVRFSNEFTFRVSADESIATEEVTIPSLIIQPFVENAIRHGVTGTGRTCYIHVQFFMNNNELYCRVEDNGKGRPEKSVKDTHHISSGVSFTVERIRLLVHKTAEEIISFRDTNEGAEHRGTTVEVLVPVLNRETA